jgi:hypothetical protein
VLGAATEITDAGYAVSIVDIVDECSQTDVGATINTILGDAAGLARMRMGFYQHPCFERRNDE